MAFLSTTGCLALVGLITLVSTIFGVRLLNALGLHAPHLLEQALYGAGIAFGLLELLVTAMLAAGELRRGVLVTILLAMAIAAGGCWSFSVALWREARAFVAAARASRFVCACASAIIFVLLIDGLMAMAPLTGSDAMNYHFTAPLLWLRAGFAPVYNTTLSFAIGQSHMLILLGLALGSDHVALGFIFVGGALAAAALYVLARQWLPLHWSVLATLSFLLTPMVFWQMAIAGSPDTWMTFYTTLTILAASRGIPSRNPRRIALAGFFAGAAAGSKYPAWAIPALLAFFLLCETRRIWPSVVCSLAAVSAGIWPLLRNAVWTGDPVFPFLSRWLAPHATNAYTLAALVLDTHPNASHPDAASWLTYPFLLVLDGKRFGVGEYFGPLILLFAPLLVLVYRRTPLFRVAAGIWAGMFLSNVASSQMARFLLPVFAIALVMTFAAAQSVAESGDALLRIGCAVSIATFLLFGAASLVLYSKDFLPVGVGLESKDHFLMRMAPDFQAAQFVNQNLQGKDGTVMVFLRHTYYLRVPYVQGDPQLNWQLNPENLRTPEAVLAWLENEKVRWVVKSGDYPIILSPQLRELEKEGILKELNSTQTENFSGWRVEGTRALATVEVFEVRPAPS
jgi:hypothetical protein